MFVILTMWPHGRKRYLHRGNTRAFLTCLVANHRFGSTWAHLVKQHRCSRLTSCRKNSIIVRRARKVSRVILLPVKRTLFPVPSRYSFICLPLSAIRRNLLRKTWQLNPSLASRHALYRSGPRLITFMPEWQRYFGNGAENTYSAIRILFPLNGDIFLRMEKLIRIMQSSVCCVSFCRVINITSRRFAESSNYYYLLNLLNIYNIYI